MRKLLALLVVSLLLVAVAACQPSAATPTAAPPTVAPTAEAAEPTEAATAEAAEPTEEATVEAAEPTEEATEPAEEATVEAAEETVEATIEPTEEPTEEVTAEATAEVEAVSPLVVWPDLGGREITIAVENLYPPYNYLDMDGNAIGWDYDTFRAICELINCTPVFVETSWDGMLIAVASGEFDVAADGITYTPERDESVDFSQLYQAYDETQLVRANEDRFTNSAELLELDDYRIGTQTGTTNEITAHNIFGSDNVQSYQDFPAAVQALLQDDVDAVVVDRPAAEGFITTQGNMKTLDESLSGIQGLAFAFPPGSDLVHPVNAAMSALQANGTWDALFTKWFESETPAQATEEAPVVEETEAAEETAAPEAEATEAAPAEEATAEATP
jgi:polar amino acid transport system substrate-binding protein